MSRFRALFHRFGWHRYCKPVMRRVGYTGIGGNLNPTSTTAVFLMADYSEHR